MRLLAIVVAVVCIGVGCTDLEEAIAVARPQPPQDAWQLAQQAAGLVPLTVAKMEALLGTPMARSDENPLRWEGGPVALGPHYPEVKLKSAPTGHSVYEQALWAVSYDWGDLAFGIREKERCLTGISLERATG